MENAAAVVNGKYMPKKFKVVAKPLIGAKIPYYRIHFFYNKCL